MRRFVKLLPFAAVLFASSMAQGADETTTYAENGISFSYPTSWKKVVQKATGVLTVRTFDAKGTQVMVQIYSVPVTPEQLQKVMTDSLKKRFGEKLVKDSERPAERKLLGKTQKGQALAMQAGPGVQSKMDFYSLELPKQKKTFFMMFQKASRDEDKADAIFKEIAASLKETAEN